ncbi:hypothetical protein F4809DRAFT_472520 [Biscogniauxia mediterranea]|nr:hypothetical protein F4809DRAFT_472520 [Biscogniauxia mediterranea]
MPTLTLTLTTTDTLLHSLATQKPPLSLRALLVCSECMCGVRKCNMSHLSRGCLRCRQRRVKCDQGRPACQRCVDRGEICEDSRDEASIIVRHGTDEITASVHAAILQSPPKPARRKSR